MANILLTERCVRKCPYCFAKEYMEEKDDNLFLSWQNIIYLADLFEISREKHISLLGGEPTLHPDFPDIVDYLIKRKFYVNIFTSGILSVKALDNAYKKLKNYDNKKLNFVCNTNHPSISKKSEINRIEAFLEKFSKNTSLGFNVYKEDFTMTFLIGIIYKYNLKRHVRLGLAHPIPGEKNIHIPKENLKNMSSNLINQLNDFEKKRISIGFDCGMPLCLFSDEEIGRLFKLNKGGLKFSCGPAIDIGIDMQVWSCFPLSKNKESIYKFNNINEIREHFIKQHAEKRKEKKGIYTECEDCIYFEEKVCSGGCLAHLY